MKITSDKEYLAKAAKWAAEVAPRRPPNPVLVGVRITATETGAEFAGFDYDTSHRVKAPASVLQDGVIVVPGRLLAAVLDRLPPGAVDIVAEEGDSRVTITAGRAEIKLPLLRQDDYPTLPAAGAPLLEVDAQEFVAAVKQVAPVADAANTDALPALGAIHMEVEVEVEDGGTFLVMYATDRYQFAVTRVPCTLLRGDQPVSKLSPPAAAVAQFVSVAMGEASVRFGFDPDNPTLLSLDCGGHVATTRLVDGGFAQKWRAFAEFAEKASTVAVVEARPLLAALDRAALVKTPGEGVRMEVDDAGISLSVGVDASASELVDATLEGEPGEFLIDPARLYKAVKHAGTAQVRVGLTNPLKVSVRPVTVKDGGEGSGGRQHWHIIQALRPAG